LCGQPTREVCHIKILVNEKYRACIAIQSQNPPFSTAHTILCMTHSKSKSSAKRRSFKRCNKNYSRRSLYIQATRTRRITNPSDTLLLHQPLHISTLSHYPKTNPYPFSSTLIHSNSHAFASATLVPNRFSVASPIIGSQSTFESRLSTHLNSCAMRARMYMVSKVEKTWPGQIRGPPLKLCARKSVSQSMSAFVQSDRSIDRSSNFLIQSCNGVVGLFFTYGKYPHPGFKDGSSQREGSHSRAVGP
jgi:hypothetical protein